MYSSPMAFEEMEAFAAVDILRRCRCAGADGDGDGERNREGRPWRARVVRQEHREL